MYFENEVGSAFLLENKIAVLNTQEGKYTFESSEPSLVKASYQDFITILKILDNEKVIMERLDALIFNEDLNR